MNRLDRVTAILIQLQSKRVVKASEIAERFNISLRTAYRDVKTLEEAGIPIIGEAGVGYSIMSGYRLPPIMFTREEATSLVVAEKIIEKYTDSANAENYSSALFKVKAVLREGEKDYLEDLNSSVVILGNNFQPGANNNHPSLQLILKAINEKTKLTLNYRNAYEQEAVIRTVDPIGVFLQNNNWHLIAFCNLKNDYRDFRLDRMQTLHPGTEKINREHPSLNAYLEKISQQNNLQKIVIRAENFIAKYIVTQKYYYGFISEKESGEHVEMTFLSESKEAFARWFLMIGANAEILEPLSLKEDVKCLISDIYKKL